MPTRPNPVNVSLFIDNHRFSAFQWSVLVMCFATIAVEGFDNAAAGFVAPALVNAFAIKREALGPVLSAGPFGLAIGALLAGPIADRVGRKAMLVASVVLFGVGTLISCFAQSIDQLTAMRLATGLGIGAAMPSATTLMSEYCPQARRSLLVTVMFCGFTLGSSAGGFAAAALIPAYGWQSVFVVGGLMPLLLGIVLVLFLPESPRFLVARRRSTDYVRRVLQRIAPEADLADATFFVPLRAGAVRNPVALIVSSPWRLGTVLLWVTYFLGLFVIILLLTWMPTLMRGAGFDLQTAANVTALFQLGGTVGALLVGWFMDRIRPTLCLSLSYLLGGCCIFMIGQSLHDTGQMAIFVLLAGFFISGSQTPINAFAAGFYPIEARATGVS